MKSTKPSSKKTYTGKPPRNGAKATPHYEKRKSPPKKTVLDIAPKNEVKEMFMSWFRRHNQVGQIMTKQDVVREVIKKLDKPQNEALEEAMNELVKSGFMVVQGDGVTLVLTAEGAGLL
ncbi:MAG: hypothetical protein PHX13_06185 [Thiovulaceae bacterium]|nr:hypothetical protein [Sulfurimonadaceae bacterium]